MNADAPLLTQLTEYATHRQITLPVFNTIAQALQDAARSDAYDIDALERGIDDDPALAATVLRAANSAFFGGLSEVATIRAAILRLGIRQVANLVLLATEKSRYDARHPKVKARLASLWRHASACALAAEWLARRLRYRNLSEEAFIGGLLHDIGKLYLLRVLDEMLADRSIPFDPFPLVDDILSQVHADQGHQLLQSWNLPAVYLTIVRDHHQEALDPGNVPLLLVRLANHACNKLGIGLRHEASMSLPATAEAEALGISDVALAELEIVLEDAKNAVAA